MPTQTPIPPATAASTPASTLASTPPLHRRLRIASFALLLMLVPTVSETQANRSCPRLARVPGYGACTNISGQSCGFCAYRCNDETVVRWNVCSL